jgi:hypothetical protein
MRGIKKSEVWCFNCDTYKVEVGKKCRKCGARIYLNPDRKYKTRLIRVRLEEMTLSEWDTII